MVMSRVSELRFVRQREFVENAEFMRFEMFAHCDGTICANIIRPTCDSLGAHYSSGLRIYYINLKYFVCVNKWYFLYFVLT